MLKVQEIMAAHDPATLDRAIEAINRLYDAAILVAADPAAGALRPEVLKALSDAIKAFGPPREVTLPPNVSCSDVEPLSVHSVLNLDSPSSDDVHP